MTTEVSDTTSHQMVSLNGEEKNREDVELGLDSMHVPAI